jgi:hypothetical protein
MLDAPDWIARWWLAFREWTHAGKLPDADALAHDLAALLPELEAREWVKRDLWRQQHLRKMIEAPANRGTLAMFEEIILLHGASLAIVFDSQTRPNDAPPNTVCVSWPPGEIVADRRVALALALEREAPAGVSVHHVEWGPLVDGLPSALPADDVQPAPSRRHRGV